MTAMVYKFYHMVYVEHTICTQIKVENKTEIMQHVLKMQQTSLLSKYTKWISKGVFFTCVYICGCRSFKVNKWDLRFSLRYECGFLNVTQCSMIAPYKRVQRNTLLPIQVRTISHVWKKSIREKRWHELRMWATYQETVDLKVGRGPLIARTTMEEI